MTDRRRANVNWTVAEQDGSVPTWERVSIALLMDIRDELQAIRRRLDCPNTLAIPRTLQTIAYNTKRKTKPRLVKRKAA